MVKCNGCGLAHQNESYVGRLHGGCKRDGSWELQSKGDMQGQQLAMADTSAQQAAMMQANFENTMEKAEYNISGEIRLYEETPKFANFSTVSRSPEVDQMIQRMAAQFQGDQMQATAMAQQAAMQGQNIGYFQNQVVESAAIQVLKKRIAELEHSCDLRKQAVLVGYDKMNQRANRLSDECGALKTQNTELLAENARLRRGGR